MQRRPTIAAMGMHAKAVGSCKLAAGAWQTAARLIRLHLLMQFRMGSHALPLEQGRHARTG